jgi:hypothetical protein
MLAESKQTSLVIQVTEITEITFRGTVLVADEKNNVGDNVTYIKSYFNFTDPIVSSVINKFKKRSELGIKKYGTTLEDNNTDNFLEHLSEELMDSLLYIQKIKDLRKTIEDLQIQLSVNRGYLNEYINKYGSLC